MAVTKSKKKRRKKKWFKVVAPKILNHAELGESHVYTEDDLIGKSLKVNQSTITNNMRNQNVELHFKIISTADQIGQTDLTGITLTGGYLKRLVRKGRDKIEDSFLVKTQNQKDVRVKPVVLTNTRANNRVKQTLRRMAKEFITEYAKKMPHDKFFNSVIKNRLQKEMKEHLSDIYPLKYVDIRSALIEGKYVPPPPEETEEFQDEDSEDEETEKSKATKDDTDKKEKTDSKEKKETEDKATKKTKADNKKTDSKTKEA